MADPEVDLLLAIIGRAKLDVALRDSCPQGHPAKDCAKHFLDHLANEIRGDYDIITLLGTDVLETIQHG